jgi:HK97 family phage major capsid protein
MRRDDIRALHEQRASLHAEMLASVGKAEQEGRDFTAEEQQEFDRQVETMHELEHRTRRAEQLYAQDHDVQKALHSPIELRAGIDDEAPETLAEYRTQTITTGRMHDSPEYRNAFFKYVTSRSVADLDVEEHRVLSRASNPAGGFTVPTSFQRRLLEARRFLGSFEELSNTIRTTSGEAMPHPVVSAFGSAVWTSENSGFTPSDDTFDQVTLNAFKASTKVIVSEELLQDSAFDLEAYLARQFGLRFRVLEESAYINGDGAGKPLGINHTTSGVATTTAAVGNATSFNYTAIVTLVFALPSQYRQNASFVLSDTTARGLYLMLDGSQRPIWNVDVTSDGGNRLLGYPVYTHPDMPASAANARSAMFGDWELAYTTRRVAGIGLHRQNELHSDNGQIGFRAWERVDGRVTMPAAARILVHSAT